MRNPFDRNARTAPSHYPKVPFHVLRAFQLISSLTVGAIMSYFIWHLTNDHWKTPWTFIFLTAASLASIAALAFTIILHCFTGLNPRLNIAINSILTLLWALGWSLLTWYMSPTLANMCDVKHWNENVGIMVCRIYKALFTFTLVGMLSTFAALGLDIYVRRKQTSRGIYKLQDMDPKSHHRRNDTYGDSRLAAPLEEEPRRSMGPYGEQSDRFLQKEGYSVPEDQVPYSDTGYRGARA